MEPFHQYMDEYKKQMATGTICKAYKGLMEYIMTLKTQFQKKYPEYSVSGNLYLGYMDMTYFALSPKSLKERNLKIAIVFLHQDFRFEIWLAGYNKQIQESTWKLLKESGWNQYKLVLPAKGVDSILEHILVENPDFSDLDALTRRIESETLQFIKDVEDFFMK